MNRLATSCLILAAAGLLLPVAAFGCTAPYRTHDFDNRPVDLVTVQSVDPEGVVRLSDARIVRLFGLRPPTQANHREYYQNVLQSLVGVKVSVDPILAGDPPAVELIYWWTAQRRCGLEGLTWWPYDKRGAYTANAVNLAIVDGLPDSLRESDLEGRRASGTIVSSYLKTAQIAGRRDSESTKYPTVYDIERGNRSFGPSYPWIDLSKLRNPIVKSAD